MAKVGIPYLKLDRQDHYAEKDRKDKHSGNMRAVILEGLKERQASDPDLKPERTALNKYYGIESGEELVTMLEASADEYMITDSRGRKRHLRNNANTAFAIICKPESEYINSLTKEQQEQFFNDSYEVMRKMLEKRGLVVDAAVVHYDEGSPHMHIYGHDPSYNMGRKFDLNMREQMNRGYYPVEMRKRGWDVEDLPRNYDPEHAKTLGEEELKAYKKECKARRKKHGQSAKTYKAEKDAAKIKADAEKQAAEIRKKAEQAFNKQTEKLLHAYAYEDIKQKKREATLDNRDGEQNAREEAQNAREAFLNAKEENYKAELQKRFKTAYTTLEKQMEEKYINLADVVQVLKAYADEHEAMQIAAEQSAKQKGRMPSEIRKEVRSSAAMIRDIFGHRNDIIDYRNQRTHELGE